MNERELPAVVVTKMPKGIWPTDKDEKDGANEGMGVTGTLGIK